MLEVGLAMAAGLGVLAAALALAAPVQRPEAPAWIRAPWARWWASREALVADAGIGLIDARLLLALEIAAAIICGFVAAAVTGLPVLAVAGAFGGASLMQAAVTSRARHRRVQRQDAVLDAVRLLRQLLATGATGLTQAISVLAERGPLPLRKEFSVIAARSVGRRQAWKEARDRVAEPLFDMLAAAVLVQRPGGGELVPLFADLESSVTAAQEVEREARALQAQARSASSIIVALPLVFLFVLSALHSPYLDAFRHLDGELFLLAMLLVMAAGYAWMRRLLDLPGLQRVRLSDA